ncbi:MAG: TonB family protein [Mariprofundales bacterium]
MSKIIFLSIRWLPAIIAALCLHMIVFLIWQPINTSTPISYPVSQDSSDIQSLHLIWQQYTTIPIKKGQLKQVKQLIKKPAYIPVIIKQTHSPKKITKKILTNKSSSNNNTKLAVISKPIIPNQHEVNDVVQAEKPKYINSQQGNKLLSQKFIDTVQAKVRYPRRARQQNWQGSVLLGLDVKDNHITQLIVQQSSGYAVLDRSAMRALQRASLLDIADGNYSLPVKFYLH